ncbi:MAG: hypothetical protein HY554_17405 [Elusimicrobia bacterium]|nr:hypothetical protein [Elusimicrobiota bacterium]
MQRALTAFLLAACPALAWGLSLAPVTPGPRGAWTAPAAAAALSLAPSLLQPSRPATPFSSFAAPALAPSWEPGAPEARARLDRLYDAQEERAQAPVELHRKREAKAYARAERPALDQRGQAYSPEGAREFAAELFDLGAERPASGRDVLALLVTPHAVIGAEAPDPAQADFDAFGLSDSQLYDLALSRAFSPARLHETLERAFRLGLVYRLADAVHRRTYTGVPHPVREALGLSAFAVARPAEPSKPPSPALGKALEALAADAALLPDSDELFEFSAQLVAAALERGLLEAGGLPEGFRERSAALGFDVPAFRDALLTLLESSRGTTWLDRAVALGLDAAEAGLVERRELERFLSR